MSQERLDYTADACERLKQAQEFAPYSMDPRVARFASFLGERMRGKEIVPSEFKKATMLALYDLQTGINGYTAGEPLVTGLEHPSEVEYNLFLLNSANLADIAFPKSFADEYRASFSETLKGFGISEDEVVLRPVTKIEDADELILESAKRKILALDWEHFGVVGQKEEIAKMCELLSLIVLRNSGMNFPLNVLHADTFNEALIIKAIPNENKREITEDYWLFLARKLDIEEATFIRDWLFINTPEAIAGLLNLSNEEVIFHFSNDNSILRADERLAYAMGLI